MARKTHSQLKKAAFKKAGVKEAYDSLEDEFGLLEMMLKARLKAGKTQEEIAKKMKTTTSYC